MNESWIQVLTIVGSNLLIMLTFFGVSISLHNGMREDVRAIQEEMKDFHREIKDHHGRMEKQDAEFKAHMMHHHTKRIIE